MTNAIFRTGRQRIIGSLDPLYEIRGATLGDEEQILAIARHLNTVNLPHDREGVQQILELSQKSFSGAIKDVKRRQYVFVLVDLLKDTIIGTSMIFGQLGRRDAPYIYLDVVDEERYSETLDKHFKHTTLSIGYSYNGPTEIGGLILHPDYRRVPERLGTFLSYVRFLFLKMHREWFRDEILAELLPPLEKDGTSHLWDALGRHFMDMSYEEADKLSRRNKEFIRGLFPEGTIYASLLPQQAQDVIGKVGAQTRGVEKLLRRIGFRYAERVDPFDGGPHFTALTDEITLVQDTQHLNVRGVLDANQKTGKRGLVAVENAEAPWFRAVLSAIELGEDEVKIGEHEARMLGVHPGDAVWVLPLD
jgi:arginine N-succinyltransferase